MSLGTRGVRSLAAGALLAVLVVPAAPAAAVEPSPARLQVARVGSSTVELLLTGDDDALTGLVLGSVRATLDGREVEAAARRPAAEQGDDRAAVLLLDVSGSMAGPRTTAARAAARVFLAAAPADLAVGLTTFGEAVTVAVPPTRDRAPVRSALERTAPRGGTPLHDALVSAARGLDGDDAVVLLSDGVDDGSRARAADASAALARSGAALTAVDLVASADTRAALHGLAAGVRGRVVPATDAAAVARALRAQADALAQQVVVSLAVPPELAGRTVDAVVTGAARAGSVRAAAPLTLAAAGAGSGWQPARPSASALRSGSPTLLGGLSLLLVGLTALAAAALGVGRPQQRDRRQMASLLSRYTLHPDDAAPGPLTQESVVARTALGAVRRLLHRRGREHLLADRLQAAGSRLQPAEWVLLRLGCAVLLAGLLLWTSGVPGAVLGGVLGLVLPQWRLSVRSAARRAAFDDALPDALALVVGGLQTGYSFSQSLDTVVREGRDPVSTEMGRALAEARLGVPLDEALEHVAVRMRSDELHWVVMAVSVQREVGGGLAEVLQTVFETMRDRARIRRQVRTLSAEGRTSAALLVCLPVFMAGFQLLFRRDYMRPMYTEPVGLLLLAGTAVALVLGALWTRALVRVEV